jgi:uncharacterized protein (DUF4415 family)
MASLAPRRSEYRERKAGCATGREVRQLVFDVAILSAYHHQVRITLTLDDDVEAKLRAKARRTGQSFKSVINDALRSSLPNGGPATSKPFKVRARDFGELRPGVSLDNIGELLEQLEGPWHR